MTMGMSRELIRTGKLKHSCYGLAVNTARVELFVPLRFMKLFNLRTYPYERANKTSNSYYDWLLDHDFLLVPVLSII